MGITGLLPYLEKASKPCNIRELSREPVAVDAYCLLHKGAYACAEQLARGEEACPIYINFCLKYVNMLKSHFVRVIMVFDGKNLPAKAQTETKRSEARQRAKQMAASLMKLGRTAEAAFFLRQCVEITPKMASNLMKALHQIDVDCIVAPYEADAQMAFLSFKGVVNCVVTEDSDLVVFGCKKVLFKLDLQGNGRLVTRSDIHLAMNMRPDQFSFEKFRYMTILSGCDYLSSLHGIGLKKAEKFVKLTQETNPEIFLNKIPRYLNMHHLEITEEYKKQFLIANATFLHQVVYDPIDRNLVHLTDPEILGTNPEYLINAGDKECDSFLALQFAFGNLNPNTGERYDNWVPNEKCQNTIWLKGDKKNKGLSMIPGSEREKVNCAIIYKHAQPKPSTSAKAELQPEQDLSMYLKKPEAQTENIEPKSFGSQAEVDKPKTRSPLSLRNPFIKNKISRFPKTSGELSESLVKSRFFGGSDMTITGPFKGEISGSPKASTSQGSKPREEPQPIITGCRTSLTLPSKMTIERLPANNVVHCPLATGGLPHERTCGVKRGRRSTDFGKRKLSDTEYKNESVHHGQAPRELERAVQLRGPEEEVVVEPDVGSIANTSDSVVFVAPFIPIVTLDSDKSTNNYLQVSDTEQPNAKKPKRKMSRQVTLDRFFTPLNN